MTLVTACTVAGSPGSVVEEDEALPLSPKLLTNWLNHASMMSMSCWMS